MKVNLGCGNHIVKDKGWVNVDNYYIPEAKNFIKADLKDLPFEKDSVDYIICDQVLEHMAMADVIPALHEIRRVLKKGGKANIIVPDFEDNVKRWLSYDHNGAFEPMRYNYLSEPIYGNQQHDGEYHKTPMCAGYLHHCLKIVGLTNNKIIFFPAHGEIPKYPGMRPYKPEATLRNAELVVEITK